MHCVDQPAAGVDADVALHAEAPFLSLFRLMHFRVACLLRVLCRSGRVDNDGVHDRAALHHLAGDFHNVVDGIEEQLVQTVFLQQIEKSLESTMRELREAIYSIRWDSKGKESFPGKLTKYMDEMQALSGARIQIEFDADPQRMTVTQKTTLYRIICEAVNNAIRHGKARFVRVKVQLSENECIAEIIDNGTGFEPLRILHGGQGLKNMYRMARRLKGQLKIDSGMGNGTAVQCRLPMNSSTDQSNHAKEGICFDFNTGRSSSRAAGNPFFNAGV